MNCSYCGGSHRSQQLINNRNVVVFRSRKSVLQTICDGLAAGIDVFHVCFDPDPSRRYYLSLFSLLRRARIRTSLAFECWTLPSHRFIEEFQRTFDHRSELIISPETSSEQLRRLHKGFYYSNDQLLRTLHHLNERKVITTVYFGYPFPDETIPDARETIAFIESLRKRNWRYCKFALAHYTLDPASPLALRQHPRGATKRMGTFTAYFRTSGNEAPPRNASERRIVDLYERYIRSSQ